MNPLSFVSRLMPRDMQAMPLAQQVQAERLGAADGLEQASRVGGVKAPEGGSFDNVLGQLVRDVNTKQLEAGNAVQGLMSGGDVSLHQAMIAMEEASVSFQLMVEVRNKLLESYQEIMRMQL